MEWFLWFCCAALQVLLGLLVFFGVIGAVQDAYRGDHGGALQCVAGSVVLLVVLGLVHVFARWAGLA